MEKWNGMGSQRADRSLFCFRSKLPSILGNVSRFCSVLQETRRFNNLANFWFPFEKYLYKTGVHINIQHKPNKFSLQNKRTGPFDRLLTSIHKDKRRVSIDEGGDSKVQTEENGKHWDGADGGARVGRRIRNDFFTLRLSQKTKWAQVWCCPYKIGSTWQKDVIKTENKSRSGLISNNRDR